MSPRTRRVPTLCALVAALLALLPAARLGAWVAADVIGLWWGLENLAGLLVAFVVMAGAGTLAWGLARLLTPRDATMPSCPQHCAGEEAAWARNTSMRS